MIRQANPTDVPGIKSLMQSEPSFWKQATRADVLEIELASAKDLAVAWNRTVRSSGTPAPMTWDSGPI